jgi:ATP-dependent DNA ligase
MPHVEAALSALFKGRPDAVIDGELYSHGMDFNTLMHFVRSDEPQEGHEAVEFHMFDVVSEPLGFADRWGTLYTWKKQFLNSSTVLILVETDHVSNLASLDRLYSEYLTADYEGQMIRVDGIPYESRRSWSLIKRKEFIDSEFRILAIEEGIGNRSGMAGKAWIDLGGGKKSRSNIKGDRAFLRDVLKRADSLVGKEATVRFFRWTTDGVPYHPRIIAIHESGRV